MNLKQMNLRDKTVTMTLDEFKKQQHFANIGRAVEKATKEGTAWIYIDALGECIYPSIEDIESICRWMQVMESEEYR